MGQDTSGPAAVLSPYPLSFDIRLFIAQEVKPSGTYPAFKLFDYLNI